MLAPVGHEKAVALELVAVFGLGFGEGGFHPGARNAQALRVERGQKVAAACVGTFYTTEAAPAKLLRNAALHLGQRFTPFRKLVAASLTGSL